MPRLVRLSLVFASVLIAAADWPRFRGPNGTGIIDDASLSTSWSNDNILDRVEVPGRGNSSPVIVKRRVYVQAAGDDGHGRMLLSFDAQTLKLLWTAKVNGQPSRTHAKNTLASGTPAADDQRVVCLFWDGRDIALHAYDHSGNALWQQPLGSFTSQHGAGHSPILYQNRVYVNLDQDGKAELLCFDATAGKKLWSVPRRAFRACYSTPIVVEQPDGPTIVVASTAGITAYDPATGKQLWNWDWPFDAKPLRNVGSPVAAPGMILAVSGDGDGSRHMVAVSIPSAQEPPRLLWEKKRGTPYVPCPIVHGDHVFWVNDNGFAGCVNVRTGDVVYDERFTSGITASPLLLNGYIVAVDERGNVFSYPAEPKFTRPRRLALNEAVYASPAVADGRLFIRGEKHLFAIGGNRTNTGVRP